MNIKSIVGVFVLAAVVAFSAVTVHREKDQSSAIALKNIKTDAAATYAATQRPDRAWFVEMVLPDKVAATQRPNRAWFVEMVLPSEDHAATAHLKAIAATL